MDIFITRFSFHGSPFKDLEFLFQDTSLRLSSHSALNELITNHSDILNAKSPENLALFQNRLRRQEGMGWLI
jgi:hypothetical protein